MPQNGISTPVQSPTDPVTSAATESPCGTQAEIQTLLLRLNALEEAIAAERDANLTSRRIQAENMSILEERLRRIENSVIFRINRAVGTALRTWRRKIGHAVSHSIFRSVYLSLRDSVDGSYGRWVRIQEAGYPSFEAHRVQAQMWTSRPRISMLMVVNDPSRSSLEQAVDSLRQQSYEEWQLCICDNGTQNRWVAGYLESVAREDGRIHCTSSGSRLTDSAALNLAYELSDGDYVGTLPADGVLHPHGLFYIAQSCLDGSAQVVYADEDRRNRFGRRTRPCFKPEWSPDLLTSCMYWGNLFVAARRSIEQVRCPGLDCFRPQYEGAHQYDLALRLTDSPGAVRHLARVLYHGRRQSSDPRASGRAIQDALARRKANASVEQSTRSDMFYVRHDVSSSPLVSIIVNSCNAKLFEGFVRKLGTRIDYESVELVCVEHQAGPSPFPLSRLKARWKRPFVHVPYSGSFNFASMCNLGAEAASGEILVFLNDDVEPLSNDWLSRIVGQVQRMEVGIVGARLLYPSGAIQHAGMALGMSLNSVGHPGRFLFSTDLFPWLDCTRNVSAVTGACLAVRTSVFRQLGGFDSAFPLDYNDVDLCLRAQKAGLLVVCESGAPLRHYESATRSGGASHRDRELFCRKWSSLLEVCDPYVPAALDHTAESIKLALWNSPGLTSEAGPLRRPAEVLHSSNLQS